MNSNIISLLIDSFKENPNFVWIECEQERLIGSQLLVKIAQTQKNLIANGISAGNHVLVFSGRGNQFWIDVMALWGIGAVVIPLDPNISASEIENVLRKANPDAYLGEPAESEIEVKKIEDNKICTKANDQLEHICHSVDKDTLGSILFTSGSTGEPKGVMLTHKAISGNALATMAKFEMTGVKKLLAPIPFRFVSSLSHFVATLYNHVQYCGTEQKLLKTQLLDLLQSTKADAFGGSPVQIRWIAELADEYDLNLKWFMSSGDNLPEQTIKAIQEKIPGINIVTAYGLTEIAGRFCILPPSQTLKKMGSVGRPIDGLEIKIRDNRMKELAVGEAGQVFVGGDFLFKGYVNDSEKTVTSLSELGFATGDVGHLDQQGYLFLSGRTDDVFKSGGLKVSTLPIAAILMSSGIFDDLAVVAEKDEILSHVPSVYYKLKPGCQLMKGQLMKVLRRELPPGHLPRRFIPIDHIPRTGSGKIKRGELKKMITELG